VFTLCDLRTSAGVEEIEKCLLDAGFEISEKEDISQQVLQSLEKVSDVRESSLTTLVTPFFRRAFRDFMAIKGTELYHRLQVGELTYISIQAIKPSVTKP
jgi:hypothetical protein